MKLINVDMKFGDGTKPALVNADSITYIREDAADVNSSMIAFDASAPIIVRHQLVDLYEMLSSKSGRPRKHSEA